MHFRCLQRYRYENEEGLTVSHYCKTKYIRVIRELIPDGGRGNGSFPLNTSDTTHWPEEEHRTDQRQVSYYINTKNRRRNADIPTRRMYQNEAQAQVDIGNDYSPLLRTMQSTTFETQNEEEMMIGDLGFSGILSSLCSAPMLIKCRALLGVYF